MTQILNLPLLSFAMTIRNNEDWTDSWAYLDAASAPISLAGLTLVMMLRATPSDPTAVIIASSVSGPVSNLPQNGSITSGGAGLNVVGLSIPQYSVSRIPSGEYVFEVQAIGDGLTRTIATGAVTVEQGVIR